MTQEPYYAPDEMFTGVEPDTRRVWPWVLGAAGVVLTFAAGALIVVFTP